jgi:trimeric autotransporter adhesin
VNAKANFAAVDARALLAKLASIPVKTWNYKSQAESIRHIGPTAQDFKAAFGVGEDETRITTVDADGVALAAIQGLYQMLQEKDASITELRQQVSALREEMRRLQPSSR